MSDTIIPLRQYSYSRSSADDHCQRERYLSREWGGTGLQPVGPASWPLVFGNLVHQGLEDLGKLGSIDYLKYRNLVLTEAPLSGYDLIASREWAAIIEGQLRGFVRAVWPHLMAEYNIVGAENWVLYTRPNGFQFRARQDLLLQSKFDGHYCVCDYKTTSNTKPRWIKSWSKNIQMHSSMMAIQQCCEVPVERALVIGLNKGYHDDRTNKQRSVFSYGYAHRENFMNPQYSYGYERSRGWEPFSVFDEFDSLESWVANMPAEVLSEQFPMTAPIPYRADIAEEWFAQQDIREEDVEKACTLLAAAEDVDSINNILRRYFKQNFAKCEPAWGFDCAFRNLCWIRSVTEDPLGSGQYERYKSDSEETN